MSLGRKRAKCQDTESVRAVKMCVIKINCTPDMRDVDVTCNKRDNMQLAALLSPLLLSPLLLLKYLLNKAW